MRQKRNNMHGVRTRRRNGGPSRREQGGGRVAPGRARNRKRFCACGQVADHHTLTGWVCARCWALENRGYDRFTGVLRREPVEREEFPQDIG